MNTNTRGMWTLFSKEVRRFLNVKMQTIIAPVLTAVMYVIVFRYAMGDRQVPGMETDYFTFLIPGLVMMSMLQNAFANTSSSLITAKVVNIHVYLLMAPLTALEIVIAFMAAAVLRSMIVGTVLLVSMWPFVHFSMTHINYIIFFGLCGSVIMGALGMIAGMWAKRFDEMALINNFIIMPLTFLSGVFYSVSQLPPLWQQINNFNPFFYLIDGFRYGFIGAGDTQPMNAAAIVLLAAIAITALCWHLWKIGWKLKE
ncbi:MAG: ABC transporter permease [Mariprofundales bacterium]